MDKLLVAKNLVKIAKSLMSGYYEDQFAFDDGKIEPEKDLDVKVEKYITTIGKAQRLDRDLIDDFIKDIWDNLFYGDKYEVKNIEHMMFRSNPKNQNSEFICDVIVSYKGKDWTNYKKFVWAFKDGRFSSKFSD